MFQCHFPCPGSEMSLVSSGQHFYHLTVECPEMRLQLNGAVLTNCANFTIFYGFNSHFYKDYRNFFFQEQVK